MASPIVPSQREPKFRGSQPSVSTREEKPPGTMQRRMERDQMAQEVVQTQWELGFKRNMRSQSEPDLVEIL
jgi:hypothetical protein